MNKPLLERLAALEHEQWAAWTQHFLSNQTPESLERWKRQVAATYEELSESDKDADRAWAKKVLELLTEGPPSAGLSTEIVTFFRARGLKKVSEGGGDGSENIQVHAVPLVELDAWIKTKRKEGCLVDYKVYAALYFEPGRKGPSLL
jgi:hypothetical protein